MADETKTFDVVFTGTGRSTGKMRNDITVDFETMKETYELATDEGPFHGGDGTAPPPLALFTAALTGCVMTQIRAFSKRLKIPIRGVEVQARLHWQGEQDGSEPYVTAPVGFDLDIALDTDASETDQRRLLEAAKKGCFIEQTLAQGLQVGHRLKLDGDWKAA
ncbi:MAG: OsmC family protein [Rhodobacter sp.]|nr:OsmC family protein [Rhodobacter sp.]